MKDRYELGELLGRGRAGVVHAGVDRLLGRRIAIKRFHGLGGNELYWLKREFRCLAEFSHRNLVELYDLVVADGDCFFTMELVDGLDFVRRFRGAADGAVDYPGLRDALGQLATGLAALHAQQKLHRDIKPHNVLVARDGRVVILDFDLALDTAARMPREDGLFSGTPVYMAPEQFRGIQATTASDWFSVGAVTYEVLTGEAPFAGDEGQRRVILGDWEIPRASVANPATPADLDELVAALLTTAPGDRAGGREILEALRRASRRPARGVERADAATSAPPLSGRREELSRLEVAFRGDATAKTVAVEGPAGIGKTTLIEHFLRGLEANGDVLVLRGRCHPREVVPFKAMDAAIDELHQFVVHQHETERAALVDPDAGVLARLFPVFADLYPDDSGDEGDPRETRRRAFTALRELFGRVASRRRVVLWLDDVHWSDRDSVELLRELRREPDPPPLLAILSFRPGYADVDDVLALARDARLGLQAEHEWRTIPVGPLADEDARSIAQASLRAGESGGAAVDGVVAEAAGNPLLLVELARHLSSGSGAAEAGSARLDAIVSHRLAAHSEDARSILELLAISAGPVVEEVLFRSGASPEDTLAALAALRSDLLVRRVIRDRRSAVEVFHDRVRDAVLSTLTGGEVRSLHRRAIDLLERSETPDSLQLVHHHLGAGDSAAAGAFALAAAERLEAAFAPHAAAGMYRRALELGTSACPDWQLQARLGHCLVQAGRGGEGARWLDSAATARLAAEAGSLDASKWQREAAEHYLRSGLHAEGLAMLRKVLAARRIRYPSNPTAALASLVVTRTGVAIAGKLPRAARTRAATTSDHEDLEAYWSAGVGLSLFDGIRAADFNARHALLARRLGDVGHMARATATEGLILAWEGGRRRHGLSREKAALGRSLAEASGNPNVLAHAILMDGASAFMEARWQDAIRLSAEAENLCVTRCQGAAWELANAHVMTGNSLACLGEFRRLREHLPEVLRKARERDDQYLLVTGRLGHANLVWLASGRPDEARRQVEDALAGPFPPGYAWQVYQGALATCSVELYEGRARAGWDHAAGAVERMRLHHMFRFLPTRVEMVDLRGRCALACALRSGPAERGDSERELMLAFARRAARRIAGEDAPWVAPFATMLEAGIATVEGKQQVAARRYVGAAAGFEALGMRMHASSARLAAAALGAGPASIAEPAEAWAKEQGIVDLRSLARVFAPAMPD